jgi:hypothetical protein
MSTEKQRKAAKRNIKKAAAAAPFAFGVARFSLCGLCDLLCGPFEV